MDWDLTWRLALTAFLAALMVGSLVRYGSQALRRLLQRRWLRKRLESYEAQDKEWEEWAVAQHKAGWHRTYEATGGFKNCRLCNPQPTSSAPTSSEATETEEATQHGS